MGHDPKRGNPTRGDITDTIPELLTRFRWGTGLDTFVFSGGSVRTLPDGSSTELPEEKPTGVVGVTGKAVAQRRRPKGLGTDQWRTLYGIPQQTAVKTAVKRWAALMEASFAPSFSLIYAVFREPTRRLELLTCCLQILERHVYLRPRLSILPTTKPNSASWCLQASRAIHRDLGQDLGQNGVQELFGWSCHNQK
jgi:hypothetical protein